MRLLLLLGLCVAGIRGQAMTDVPLVYENKWDGRFKASATFHVTEELNGWAVVITFDKPVGKFDVWTADEVLRSADNKEITLADKPQYGLVHRGDTLKVEFFANYPGSTLPQGTATLVNLGKDTWTPDRAPPENDGAKYNYNEVLEKSILFYEAQRSGKLPADNRIPWRGDSALQDHGDNGEDLSGGWYDAGDHVKFNFPMAYTVTTLAWGLIKFHDAYLAAGQLDYMYDCIRWPLEYLLKCHVAPEVFYGQVGNGGTDHGFWGRPENMTMARPAYKIDATHPGSDLASEVASAFAASYLAFKHRDPTFANELLGHAKQMFAFAEKYPGKYSESITDANAYYSSFDYHDEYCWGGAWMYLATGEDHYLQVAEDNYETGAAWGQSWDEKNSGCMVLLWHITKNTTYKADIEATFSEWMPGGSIPYTPKGLAFRLQWAANRYAANMAEIAIMASEEGIHPQEYRKWAESQVNYMLGDGGHSYMVGFGKDSPTQPHHRGSSCPSWPAACGSNQMNQDAPNPHVLYGALVGGPGQNDDYTDRRTDFVHNEVACDYNAGFQTAVAGLKHYYMTGALP